MTGKSNRPYRAGVCTVTPFDEAGRLDEHGIEDMVERIAGAGVSLAIGTASPGEGHALSLDETARFFDIVVRVNAGRVPICAMGVEPRNDGQLQPLIRLAEQAKLDTMQLYTVDPGHAMQLNEGEHERYFATMLDSMTIPATISTHAFNGLVPLPVLSRLLDHYPNISAIHCTSEVNYLLRLLEIVDDRCEILVGGPMQALSVHALGGNGFLSSEGILAPVLLGELQTALRAGDLAAAEVSYRKVIGLFALNIWPGASLRYIKAAMRILGLPGGYTRPPFDALDPAAIPVLVSALKKLALPEHEGKISAG